MMIFIFRLSSSIYGQQPVLLNRVVHFSWDCVGCDSPHDALIIARKMVVYRYISVFA